MTDKIIEVMVATLLLNEPTNEVIINREMAVTKSTLLEMVLMT